MGCNSRDKSLRGNRKARNSSKQQQQHQRQNKNSSSSTTNNNNKPLQHRLPADPNLNVAAPDTNLTVLPSSSAAAAAATESSENVHKGAINGEVGSNLAFDDVGVAEDLGYCTEEQLEDLLLAKLDFLYKDALSQLSALGYDDELALRAVLRNGHCYGSMDVLSNILHNAISYINSTAAEMENVDGSHGTSPNTTADSSADNVSGFSDLRQLQECALTGMICLLQELQPHLSRGDAMWCLLKGDLHVGRASAVEVPAIPSPPTAVESAMPPSAFSSSPGGDDGCENADFGCLPVPYGVYRFHGGCGGEREGEAPRRFHSTSLSSSSSSSSSSRPSFKRDASASSAGFCINPNASMSVPKLEIPAPCLPSASGGGRGKLSFNRLDHSEEAGGKNSDVVASVLKSMENMSLEEKEHGGMEDPRNDMILNLVNQIRDLEEQVKERKDWAQQKAMQAARKLSNDMMELKLLRMERDENQRLKKGKQTLEDATMKRLSEMENALRKASGQVDRANAAVRQLEAENAELRAEMEASKLSNAESERTCMEMAKREKKYLKKLLSREKQKEKMEEEAAEVRKKIAEVQHKLQQIAEDRRAMEAKVKETIKEKEQAILLVEEESRTKEAAEEHIKRRYETFRQKNEIDLQRQKDDIQRLEEELSRLRSSSARTRLASNSSNILPAANVDGGSRIPNGTNWKTVHGSQKPLGIPLKSVNRDRECIMCKKDEVSVVFLPCSHQVLCISCNEIHEKRANTCPCCVVAVEQRVRVYGASS